MRGEYVTATVWAEVKRSRRTGIPIDREFLHTETGVSWNRLEVMISAAAQDLMHLEADPMPEAPQAPFPPLKFWPANWKPGR